MISGQTESSSTFTFVSSLYVNIAHCSGKVPVIVKPLRVAPIQGHQKIPRIKIIAINIDDLVSSYACVR